MPAHPQNGGRYHLHARRLGVHTYRTPVVYMRRDCGVCRAEGFEAESRVAIRMNGREVIATIHVVDGRWLDIHEAGLSEAAWQMLGATEGAEITVSHAPLLDSLSHLRAKVYGQPLPLDAYRTMIGDIAAGRYSDLHLAAFVTAWAGGRIEMDEIAALTQAMVEAGERIDWHAPLVADKHCIGGLPGNRTTPIVVAVVAAAGITIPKTSSRAITSPAGTADAVETLTNVDLDLPAMRRVVEREGGCMTWGGAVRLSPADDILIRVERPLDFDGEAQLIASVLSKKIAAGATHAVIDIPMGPTAKVRSQEAAAGLAARMQGVAEHFGLSLKFLFTDGAQPVGRGIGPALEARDVLRVLRNEADAPDDLRRRALALAAGIFEQVGLVQPGQGLARAAQLLASGEARRKFEAICIAQGGLRTPPVAAYTVPVTATVTGTVRGIDNRRLARVAKLAGAPKAPAAGVELHAPLGTRVERGMPLFTIHAQTPGELDYARHYADDNVGMLAIEEV